MMKKAFLLIMICCTMLAGLTGCGTKIPDAAVDGTPWDKEWLRLGPVMGVEEPGHGLTLRDEKSAKKMFYTAWSIGEAQSYVNSSGNDTNRYDAQLVVLLLTCDTEEDAQLSVEDWLTLAADNYTITDTVQQNCNGQEYTVLTYTFTSETSPYARGVSAFTTFGTWAISAELACQDTFGEDAQELLTDFLNHCHYAAD